MGAPSKAATEWAKRLARDPLPVPAQRLDACRQLLGQRNASLAKVAAYISRDAALSLRLLSKVNRVRRGNDREPDVLSVETAVNLLGEHALRSHLNTCPVLEDKLSDPEQQRDYLRHLDRARLSAELAAQAAQARGERSFADLYSIALLRETPRLALCLHDAGADAQLTALLRSGEQSLAAAAQTVFACRWPRLLHELLLRQWALPTEVCAEDEWLLDANLRDLGPRIAAELAQIGMQHGWYHPKTRELEGLLAEHIWGKPQAAHAVVLHSLLAISRAGDWLADSGPVQALLHPTVLEPAAPTVEASEKVRARPVVQPVVPAKPAAAEPKSRQPAAKHRDDTPGKRYRDPHAERAARHQRQRGEVLAAAKATLREQAELERPSLSTVLRAWLQGSVQGLGIQQGAVLLRDGREPQLRCRLALGQGSDALESLYLPLSGKQLAAALFRKRGLLHVNPAQAARYRPLLPVLLRELGWDSDYLLASVFAGERPLALLLARGQALRDERVASEIVRLYRLADRACAPLAPASVQAQPPRRAGGGSAAG